MNPGNNYTYITTAATTVIGPAGFRRVNLQAIFVNKVLAGTVTIKSGSTTIGVLAAATPIGTYWFTSGDGTEVADLQIVNGSTEDLTISWNNV